MSLRLSPKHGVNPAIPKCFYCLKDKNEVILAGLMRGDAEAPRGAVWDKTPCEKCKEYMARGVIMISVRIGETDFDNPYRTGAWIVASEAFIRREIVPPEMAEDLCKRRVCFVPDDAWDALGLPRGEVPGVPTE